ncbi:hypothetical protein AYO21_01061 [Fonsecaea monophora]|uniref:Uncharacterized protein n=1 Tax=Fonsecaea monophora TaxID=254056 RepID=A0A177FL91_9EURO|nr:hypothetical protein AYO21_01061 [Fonsecaea monophora]KAH0841707.1 hypothetical protein FOPE_07058 [Fonsecaea pedrosoi]OAG44571.1 hypothetical protein AYO21_01061 [Fonsecaea monophora]
MDKEVAKRDRNAELMGDNIIGIYLSEDAFLSPEKSESPGDKLRRFVHSQERIQNLRPLGSGIHWVVCLATIKDTPYVLKVFYKWKQPGPRFYSCEEAIYITPLAYESRAFARLDSSNQNGNWAIRCHGWMKLADTQFNMIKDVVATCGLSSHDLSRWVIVKEYGLTPTNASHVPEILENFVIPMELKISPQDLRPENFRGSKMVDLSCALTYPCPGWSEYEFKFFYTDTIRGVLDWFKS